MEGWWAASYVVLWLLVLALCVVVIALARQIGTLHLRLGPRGALEIDDEGPPLGEAPERMELPDLDRRTIAIGGPQGAQLLLFVSPGCIVCEEVLPGVDAVAASGSVTPIVLSDVDAHETRRSLLHKGLHAPLVPAIRAFGTYSIPGTPYVVVLDQLGIVRAKGTVNNLEQMEGLVDSARRRTQAPSVEAV